jgi:acyl-CoA reductase-like NAD-dependent aldehyde dehydrogenase
MSLPRFAARSYDFAEFVPARNWVGGAWREPAGAAPRLDVPNPRWGRPMASVALSAADDVARAVDAARAASRGWRETPIRDRAQILYAARALMLRDLEELAWLVSH